MVQTWRWQEEQIKARDDPRPYWAYIRVLKNIDLGLESNFMSWVHECSQVPDLATSCPVLAMIVDLITTSWWQTNPHAVGLHAWDPDWVTEPLGVQWLHLETVGSNSLERRSSRITRRMSSGRASRTSSVAAPAQPALPAAPGNPQGRYTNRLDHLPAPAPGLDLSASLVNMFDASNSDQGGDANEANNEEGNSSGGAGQPDVPHLQQQQQQPYVPYHQQQQQHNHGQQVYGQPVSDQLIYFQPVDSQGSPADVAAEGSWDWATNIVLLALQQHGLHAWQIQHMTKSIHKVRRNDCLVNAEEHLLACIPDVRVAGEAAFHIPECLQVCTSAGLPTSAASTSAYWRRQSAGVGPVQPGRYSPCTLYGEPQSFADVSVLHLLQQGSCCCTIQFWTAAANTVLLLPMLYCCSSVQQYTVLFCAPAGSILVVRNGELCLATPQNGDQFVVALEQCSAEQTVGFWPGPVDALQVSVNTGAAEHFCILACKTVCILLCVQMSMCMSIHNDPQHKIDSRQGRGL